MAECERTGLDTLGCYHCRPAAPKPPRVEVGPIIDARFPGTCGSCGERFEEGERIGRNPEDGWVRMECCGQEP